MAKKAESRFIRWVGSGGEEACKVTSCIRRRVDHPPTFSRNSDQSSRELFFSQLVFCSGMRIWHPARVSLPWRSRVSGFYGSKALRGW